ncbi:peptide ABC transporter ATP-binding protein [Streptomyces agglomeratus]|uniref:ABC transporter ATP-binding protein n=1 Tax=Streptomyces agglomeratus TaxID=285458 RepID=UPI00086D613D|nr:ABC transporter ATP-binding protein [Streptomyces agglomeratus]OEJ62026.1 peptide ABC transporter ATP-binding protein [Streptomyces agglomeratus]
MRATPAIPPRAPERALLDVRDLHITVRGLHAVRGLSFSVRAGEALAVVGESGAGKSLTARAVLGLLPAGTEVRGSVRFDGREWVGAPQSAYRELRGRRTAFVPQDALSVLSPVHTVGEQLALAVRSVRRGSRAEATRAAVAALEQVGIADAGRRARAYPHEFSGGMRQRAVIAMAVINRPELIVADEPTTALDPTVQDRILHLLGDIRKETGAALLLVTHDLGTVAGQADSVLVMYAGRPVESGPVTEVFEDPRTPYTAGLIASVPPARAPRGAGRRLPSIAGAPPSPSALPPGCAFAPRCPAADEICGTAPPEPVAAAAGRTAACHRLGALPVPLTRLFEESAA